MSAATWGDEASALLDWLEVEPGATGWTSMAVTGRSHGVVLLDLPDHDSVNADNRAIVDRVVPMADLLVWVMDPQKYADNARALRVSCRWPPITASLRSWCSTTWTGLHTDEAWEVVRDLQRLLAESMGSTTCR